MKAAEYGEVEQGMDYSPWRGYVWRGKEPLGKAMTPMTPYVLRRGMVLSRARFESVNGPAWQKLGWTRKPDWTGPSLVGQVHLPREVWCAVRQGKAWQGLHGMARIVALKALLSEAGQRCPRRGKAGSRNRH